MSIRTNIEEVMEKIKDGDTTLGDTIRQKAVLAIMCGDGSSAWEDYMQMFSRSSEQLARLMPTDSTDGVFEMDLARTYLVGNGPCGAITTGLHLLDGVGDTLDQGL
jgi:hypothetical protein